MDEKITVTAEFSQTDVAAALMCLGEELTWLFYTSDAADALTRR